MGAGAAFSATCGFLWRDFLALTYGPFPTGTDLYVTYLTYAAGVIFCLHVIFFGFNRFHLMTFKRPMSKWVPKYLEYAYAGVLLVGLAQVFFAGQRYADYIRVIAGDEDAILDRIKGQAKEYVEGGCTKANPEFFDVPYCNKLRDLIATQDLKRYVYAVAMKDAEFLNHPVGWNPTSGQTGATDLYLKSPIAEYVNQLTAMAEFGKAAEGPLWNNVYGWLGLLLLPLGIGLRVVKTSLERFGGF
jgi:hypothetical protein